MSQYARSHPDSPELWDNPPLPPSRLVPEPQVDAEDAIPDEPCEACGGQGSWSVTYIDADGRDYDDEYDCPTCDGAGMAS